MVISSQRGVALLSRFTQVSRLSRASRLMTRRSTAPSLRTSRPSVQVRTAGLQARFQKLSIGDRNGASSSSSTFPARSPRISALQPSRTSTILSLLAFSRRASAVMPIATGTHAHTVGSVRTITYGMEYQPSQRIRKRRHGFLARIKSRGGRKVLIRRRAQGRKHISH